MNQADEIRAQVRAFILKQFPAAQQPSLGDKDSLVDGGIIDSMGILEVVAFIESRFDILLSNEEVVSDSFDSVATMSTFINEKLLSSQD